MAKLCRWGGWAIGYLGEGMPENLAPVPVARAVIPPHPKPTWSFLTRNQVGPAAATSA
jgi:hypothetical protein